MGMIAFIPQGIYCAVSGDIPVVVGRGGDAADMQWAETRNDDCRHPPGKGQPRHRGISSPGHQWYLGEKRGEVSQCSASPSMFCFLWTRCNEPCGNSASRKRSPHSNQQDPELCLS